MSTADDSYYYYAYINRALVLRHITTKLAELACRQDLRNAAMEPSDSKACEASRELSVCVLVMRAASERILDEPSTQDWIYGRTFPHFLRVNYRDAFLAPHNSTFKTRNAAEARIREFEALRTHAKVAFTSLPGVNGLALKILMYGPAPLLGAY